MAGFKTFTAAALTASDVNGYLMRQAVVQCTEATKPASPHEGMTIFCTDSYQMWVYANAAWRYGPLLRQWYQRTPALYGMYGPKHNIQRWTALGARVQVSGVIVIDTNSGITGTITCDIPFAAENVTNLQGYVGSAWYVDSGSRHYPGTCYISPNGGVINFVHGGAGNAGLVNGTNPFAFQDSDIIGYSIEYEA